MVHIPVPHHGIDYGSPNFDLLGLSYVAFAFVYSALVLSGLVALFKLRHTHAVRIRSFWTIFGSVILLHAYLVLILLVYPLNGIFKCGWEFWTMSLLLPLGIALFQASNIRLYAYSMTQKDIVAQSKSLVNCNFDPNQKKPNQNRKLRHWSVEKQTYVAIAFGVIAQLVITTILFFGSRKFHSSYGFFAASMAPDECRRGSEWIPSVFWQFLWATVFGPFILLRIRKINDAHYWALQTRLAVIACLPGTPLWLTFVYARNRRLDYINKWFPPSGWFLPGLFTIQFVTIFFPLFDLYKRKQLNKRRNSRNGNETASAIEEKTTSMMTLEMRLRYEPTSLLIWASEKEFTAENIAFLISVLKWRKNWKTEASKGVLTELQLRERYEEAALIYFKLINPHTARMNINIDHKTFAELRDIFKGCHYQAFPNNDSSCPKSSSTVNKNVIAPWENSDSHENSLELSSFRYFNVGNRLMSDDIDKLYRVPVTEISPYEDKANSIPANFSIEIFDRAFEIRSICLYHMQYVVHGKSKTPKSTKTECKD
ncbi:uncharacterized protein PV09_08670 [Verruconis gallopava]|uniref:RGS domain-containing protein n=1 Tax=Verruconis gallopava TaxID=253628 RepID=A0A0D2A0A0_9PEZI|nr:uncharacterized protein PV09_08670 [Verruconis gallopava]KIV99749.1 hypothetical protein PV09_08670 [Verruconis gallopava]